MEEFLSIAVLAVDRPKDSLKPSLFPPQVIRAAPGSGFRLRGDDVPCGLVVDAAAQPLSTGGEPRLVIRKPLRRPRYERVGYEHGAVPLSRAVVKTKRVERVHVRKVQSVDKL